MHFQILKQVGSVLDLDWGTVRYSVASEPFGDVAGVYNILTFREQQKHMKDWSEVNQAKRINRTTADEPKIRGGTEERKRLEDFINKQLECTKTICNKQLRSPKTLFSKQLERPNSPQTHSCRAHISKSTPRSPAAITPKRPATSYIPVQQRTKVATKLNNGSEEVGLALAKFLKSMQFW